MVFFDIYIQSDPDLPNPDLLEPRFTGRINFPQYRELVGFDPEIPGTPIYRAKPFPPRIPVNRGPTVHEIYYVHTSVVVENEMCTVTLFQLFYLIKHVDVSLYRKF